MKNGVFWDVTPCGSLGGKHVSMDALDSAWLLLHNNQQSDGTISWASQVLYT
jgi:hypothetical protein